MVAKNTEVCKGVGGGDVHGGWKNAGIQDEVRRQTEINVTYLVRVRCIDHAFVRSRYQHTIRSCQPRYGASSVAPRIVPVRVYLRGFRRNGPRQSRLEPNVYLSRADSEDGRCSRGRE